VNEASINPDELPSGWATTTLGTVVNYGDTNKAEPSEIADNDWILELEDIEKDSSRLLQRVTFSERRSKSTKNSFRAGDVLYGKLRPYLNKVLIADQAGYCSTEVLPIETSEHLDNRYLFYWLKHPVFLKYVEAESHGMNMPRLGTDTGRAAPFVLAPYAEQTRIADQLDALLARLQTCNGHFDAIPELLKRFRKTVLDAGGSGELTEYWRNTSEEKVNSSELISTLMESLSVRPSSKKFSLSTKDVPIAFNDEELPAGWLITRIGFVGNVSNGSTPSRKQISYWNGNIPWVSSGEVANGIIRNTREKVSEEGFEKTSIRLLSKGTVLIAMIGEGKTRGQSALLDIDACINQNVAGVAPFKDLLDSKYLWYWFQREYENTRTKGNGSGPKALNCERVRELEINLPPLAEQTEIVRRVEALFALADRIEARYTAARAHAQRLTPLLLAKAFRGELVPQDPNDEPASALLQRIAEQRKQAELQPKPRKPRMARAARAPKETAGMTKSRQDADVKDQPYLADHLRRLGGAHTAEALFKVAELPVADFYKQLAWEVDKGHIKDHKTALEAGHAS
jgi:type I restriction enzyme, S subunit